MRVGRAGELAVGIIKNTEHIASALNPGKYRIPDQLLRQKLLITEVKNAAVVSYTKQLRDYAAIAQREGYTFELIVRKATRLSKPLQAAVDRGHIILRRVLP